MPEKDQTIQNLNEEPKKFFGFKSLLPYLGALLVLFLGIAGGYYYYLNQKPDDNGGNNNPTEEKSKVTDLGDGWMLYENFEYGLSFEYPDFWSKNNLDLYINLNVNYDPNLKNLFYLNEKDEDRCLTPSNSCNHYLSFYLYDKALLSDKPLYDWYINLDKESPLRGGSEIEEFEKIIISNTQSWKLKMKPVAGDADPNVRYYFIEILNKHRNYFLQIIIPNEEDIQNQALQRILNTLSLN